MTEKFEESVETTQTTTPKARRGRPPKALVESKKAGNRGKVGRPPGDAARIEEFKARLLSTSGTKVIDKILRTVHEDGHPAQAACMKMCMDRMLPIGLFERDAARGKGMVTINILNASDQNPVTIEMQPPEESDIESE